MKKTLLGLTIFLLSGMYAFAQVGINNDNSAPDPSAMLDVKSTTKGVLVPRMTIAQRNAISNPATGLMVFCTDNNQYYSNQGTSGTPNWVMMSSQWLNNGSTIYYNSGNVGIGVSNPPLRLEVAGNMGVDFGTSTQPSYTFYNGSEGAGLSSPDYSTVSVITTNQERVRFTSNGNVGIGTTSPTALLEVAGQAKIYPLSGSTTLILQNRTSSDFSQLLFNDPASQYKGYLGYIGATAPYGARDNTMEIGSSGVDITFRPGENETMRLTS